MEIQKKKIAVVFGTRPDTIKLAPVIRLLRSHERHFSLCLIATAQHREMLDDVLSVFGITPNYDLDVMSKRQSLSLLTQTIIEKLDYLFAVEQPDLVIVQGDTATTFVASLAAFHRKIPVAHVEAGLRTGEKFDPFPEEIYRRLTSQVTDLHFTPTPAATKALTREGVSRRSIVCAGNTVIDALRHAVNKEHRFSQPALQKIDHTKQRTIIVTAHRRENWGEPMKRICSALKILSSTHPDVTFVFPVHLNPDVKETVHALLSGIPNILLIEPLNYSDFINLVARSYAVITDSGGLQEEAPSLGKPVLVLREVTERPEAVKFGTVKLVGTDTKSIVSTTSKLLTDKKMYRAMSTAVNPYGDGKSSGRIVNGIMKYFGFMKKKVTEFVPSKK